MHKEIGNIINNGDGVKTVNYVKLNAIFWGCVQQQQTKIEHLEATMFEMMEEIKELKGKKKQLSHSESSLGQRPKPKAKAKPKDKDEN